jgi:5-methylcytosine-specific restriction endonuclease McrA
MARSLCTVCGTLTTSGPRCSRHPRRSHELGKRTHTDPRWTDLSKRVIARHVGQYGWVCPGDGAEHPAHPSRDLTADHIVPLAQGGAEYDERNLRVLCRSWNSTLGARLGVEMSRARAIA